MANRRLTQPSGKGPADLGCTTFIVVFLMIGFVVKPIACIVLGTDEFIERVGPGWAPYLLAAVVALLVAFVRMLWPSRRWERDAAGELEADDTVTKATNPDAPGHPESLVNPADQSNTTPDLAE